MSGDETGTRDREYIIAFEKLIANRKAIPDDNLRLEHLEGLRTDYEILRPLLPVSQPCKEEIHRMITRAIKEILGGYEPGAG